MKTIIIIMRYIFIVILSFVVIYFFSFNDYSTHFNFRNQKTKKNDVTFFITSDTHYGKTDSVSFYNARIIEEMNKLPGLTYPVRNFGKVKKPSGLVITGDLTEGEPDQWKLFVDDMGLNGKSGKLQYPVYEGFGNHDGLVGGAIREGIKERNPKRKKVKMISENGLHYSWEWDNYHFANLNLYPGSTWDSSCEWCHYFKTSFREAEKSLEFLKNDLEINVGNSKKEIILFFHYGFDEWGHKWWTLSEMEAFYSIIKDYNVKAIFYGHTHSFNSHKWRGIPVICVGSSQTENGPGDFLVVSIKGNRILVAQRKIGEWGKSVELF
jgi:cytolysin (calcineurin-like family phosphatase)